MRRERTILIDRIPSRIGLHAHDLAGIQLTRLWAVPLIEQASRTREYSLVGLESVDRLDERIWGLTPRIKLGISPRNLLASWKQSAAQRGYDSFFFMESARVESCGRLVVTTRHAYDDIRPFLDAYDLWFGLEVASDAWSRRVAETAWPMSTLGGRICRVHEVRDIEAARQFEASNPHLDTIRCALPGPFDRSEPPMRTALPYVLVPRRPIRTCVEGDLGAVHAALRESPSFRSGFAPSSAAGYFLNEAKIRGTTPLLLAFTNYFPNADVARAIGAGIRSTIPGVKVRLRLRAYDEQYASEAKSDYNLTILTPVNSSATGELRSMLRLAARSLAPTELDAVVEHLVAAETSRSADTLRRAQLATYITTGIGLFGHYMGRSGAPGCRSAEASSLGIVPLENGAQNEQFG